MHFIGMVVIRSVLLQQFTAIQMPMCYCIENWILAVCIDLIYIVSLSYQELYDFRLTISRCIVQRGLF